MQHFTNEQEALEWALGELCRTLEDDLADTLRRLICDAREALGYTPAPETANEGSN